ncbi:MAG: hypothetical protein WCX31_21895 [Salinivirgaceae bacterium]|jgi:hypothetical protein
MKNLFKVMLLAGAIIMSTATKAQQLPLSYEAMFNEIVTNFETIRGGNTINDGKTSLRLLAKDKIVLRLDHKKTVKTLTFTKGKDEEGNEYWISGSDITTDMVNKYEKDLTEILEDMLKLSREKSKI